MNTSFNLVLNKTVSVKRVLREISRKGKLAIANGPSSVNPLSEEEIQLITILDCTREEFNQMKRQVSLKTFFTNKIAY